MEDSFLTSLPQPYPPGEVLVLGAGRFGRMAVERLSKRLPKAAFLVVDSDEEKLGRIRSDFNFETHLEDAVSYIAATSLPDHLWIVPAVPVHVGFLWVLSRIRESDPDAHSMRVPDSVDSQVPNPYRVEKGTVYTSYATFLCPDTCSEPDEICTFTKKPRPGNLFEQLSRLTVPGYHTVVIRSWQLAPGVGGYPAGYLKTILDAIVRRDGNYLIATSCRCHGVIDALSWNASSPSVRD